MAATAVREVVANKGVPKATEAGPVRRGKRRRKSKLRKLARRLLVPTALLAAFVYIGLYAGVTAASYHKSKLTTLRAQERVRNERLRVELIRRLSPGNVTASAQKEGMVCATQYDYLSKPATVASAHVGEERAR